MVRRKGSLYVKRKKNFWNHLHTHALIFIFREKKMMSNNVVSATCRFVGVVYGSSERCSSLIYLQLPIILFYTSQALVSFLYASIVSFIIRLGYNWSSVNSCLVIGSNFPLFLNGQEGVIFHR